MSDSTTRTSEQRAAGSLASTLIRDLVEEYPATMAILAPLGIDLCCGGGHALGEALSLHGLDQDAVLPQVAAIIEASAPRRT